MATGAVIAGFFAVGTTTAAIIAAGINMAISFAASYLLAKQATSGGTPSASDYKQTLQQDKVAQRVMYGRRQVSIVMNFAEEQDGVQDISDKDGESHELLYLSGMFCNHPVNSFGEVHLDDKPLSDYGSNATVHHINGTGIIPPEWLEEATQYEPSMTGSGGYWAAMRLRHDSTVFSGIPTLKVTVEGKKVKDFRTGQMVYTNNAALVIADFYINYMNIPESRLLMTGTGSFIDAANICDENMPDGNKRYEINGMFELDAKPSDILNEMLKSCGGTLIRMNGVIGLLPAAYYGEVSPFIISESDIVGGISMSPQESLSDCVNIMSGTYVEEEDDWSEQDFPPIPDEAAIARDGFEIPDDINYTYVTNALQAQRLVNIELRRRTAGGFTELTMSPKGAYCRVGRVVEMNLPQLNLSGEFRVTSQIENEDLTFTITMQRDDIEIYDDAVGEPYSPPPLLDLGGGTLASPSGVQFVYSYNDAVGNVIQGVLTWQNNSASTSYFNVVITDSEGDIVQAGDTKGYVFNVNALPIGNYLGKVRAVDTRGRTSSYATTSFSVGEPSAPASFRDIASPPDGAVHSLYARSNWNIAITPNIIGGTPQGTEFEFWHLADSGSYISGQPEYDEGSINLATLVATASSLNNGGLIPDRWQHYWVRSVNPYGKSDFIYLQTGTAKEQDLVTTVVERLKAIEVESQNWVADPETNWSEYGYKLFSAATGVVTMPDGTVLENPDGLAVFQNAVVNGHITAKSLTFVEGSIPPEIDNSKIDTSSIMVIPNASSYTNQPDSGSDGELYVHGSGGDNPFNLRFGSISLTLQPDQINCSKAETYYLAARKDGGDIFDLGKKIVGVIGNLTDGYSAYYYTSEGSVTKEITDPESYMVFGRATNDATEHVLSAEILKAIISLELADFYQDSLPYPSQSSIQIQGNYTQGSSGWAIDKYGNAEFNNIIARGDGYFNNGWFKGTVYADKISGDVVSALVLSKTAVTAGVGWTTFDAVKVVGSSSKSRRLVVTVALKAESSRSGTGNSGTVRAKGRARITGTFGTVYSQYLETGEAYHSDQDGGTTMVVNNTEATLIVTVPANSTGTMTVQVDADYGSVVVSGTSGTNWVAQLVPNGSDLGS